MKKKPAPDPRLVWKGEWAPDVRALVEPHVNALAFILPPWCYRLEIFWRDEDQPEDTRAQPGTIGRAVPSERYRGAVVRFFPAFLTYTEHERRVHVAHEFVHVATEGAIGWTDRLLERVREREDVPEWIAAQMNDEWMQRVEAMTTDLAVAIASRTVPPAPQV